jgi:hypothetical protein
MKYHGCNSVSSIVPSSDWVLRNDAHGVQSMEDRTTSFLDVFSLIDLSKANDQGIAPKPHGFVYMSVFLKMFTPESEYWCCDKCRDDWD